MHNAEKFGTLIGQSYNVSHPEKEFSLTLKEVKELSQSQNENGGVSLMFASQEKLLCPQGTYEFTGEGFNEAVFMVPVGETENGILYEVVIN